MAVRPLYCTNRPYHLKSPPAAPCKERACTPVSYSKPWRNVSSRHYAVSALPLAVPRKVWVIWFGKPMHGPRLGAFQALKRNVGVPVELVTEGNLRNFTVDWSPLHPAFEHLTAVHRSDYLWAYLGYHHGGGFHDVKAAFVSWAPYFDQLEEKKDKWLLGTPQSGRKDVACQESSAIDDPACLALRRRRNETDMRFMSVHRESPTACHGGLYDRFDATRGACCERVRNNWLKTCNVRQFILRPMTPLAADWLRLAHEHLDYKAERLRAHPAPATPRCCFNHNNGYPNNWAELKGEMLEPLQVKYATHLVRTLPRGDNANYRDATEDTAR